MTSSGQTKMNPWQLAGAIAGGVVLTLLLVITFANGRDFSWAMKDKVEAQLGEHTGRPVEVNGRIGFVLSWNEVRGFADEVASVGDETTSTGITVRVEQASVTLGLWSLLGGNIDLRGLTLREADVVLPATHEQAEAAGETEDAGNGLPRADRLLAMLNRTNQVTIDNLHIVRERRNGEPQQIDIDHMIVAPEGQGLRAIFVGDVDGTPYDIDGHLASLGNYMRGDGSAMTFTAGAGQNQLHGDGTLTRIWPLEADFTFAAEAGNVARLTELLGRRLAAAGAGRMSGAARLRETRAHVSLTTMEVEARAASEETPLIFGPAQGDVVVSSAAGGRISIGGTLSSRRMDVSALLETDASEAETEASEEPVEGEHPPLPFAHISLPYGALARADLGLDLIVETLRFRDLELDHVEIPLTVNAGSITINEATARHGEGLASLRLSGDAESHAFDIAFAAHRFELGEVAEALGAPAHIRGPADVAIEGSGQGETVGEIVSSFTGQSNFMVGRGQLARGGVDFLAADLLQTFFSDRERGSTRLRCLVNRIDFSEGVGELRAFLLDTELITMTGTGRVNLAENNLRLRLAPRPKDPTLLSLAADYTVRGPLQNPRIRPDADDIIRGVATTLGSFALTGGAAALLPLIGHQEEHMANPCIVALTGEAPAEGAAQ